MDCQRLEATVLCRAAADKLNSAEQRDRTVLFPAWDYERTQPDERGQCDVIRRVAAAIVGGDAPEHGSVVTLGDLASLVYYIADMLEE